MSQLPQNDAVLTCCVRIVGNPEVGYKRRSGKLQSSGIPRRDRSLPRSHWLRGYFNAYGVRMGEPLAR